MRRAAERPPRLAYILAASHSGSTLLAMLLGAHPQACTVGELKLTDLDDAEQYRCSCGEHLRNCSFWTRAREIMVARGMTDFDLTRAGTSIFEVPSAYARRLLAPLYRGFPLEEVREVALRFSSVWQAHLEETQHRNVLLISALQEMTGAELVIDSSKLALRLKYLLSNPGLEVKVIRLVRDGRAASLTYTDEWTFADAADPARRGGGTGTRRPAPRQNIVEGAHEWRRSNESADALVARLPQSQWMRVRYEDLCLQPRDTLKSLCQFLGLDPALVTLDFRSKEQHVVGNGMRLDSTSEIRLDERWRTHLSLEHLQQFDRVAGRLNRQYGYI